MQISLRKDCEEKGGKKQKKTDKLFLLIGFFVILDKEIFAFDILLCNPHIVISEIHFFSRLNGFFFICKFQIHS